MRPSARSEGGFTLVEVLVVVAILGVVAAALTESIIIGLKTTTSTVAQVSGSFDRQRVATAFVPDVQSAQSVTKAAADPYTCAGAGTHLVTLARTDRGVKKVASYFVETPTEGSMLKRRYCEAGAPVIEQVVADNLSPSGAPPTVVCDDGPDCAAPTRTVTLTVSDARGVEYKVSATPRSSP